jgi:hypothetical protein
MRCLQQYKHQGDKIMVHPMIINANAQARYDDMLQTAANYRLAQRLNKHNEPRLPQLFAYLSSLLTRRQTRKKATVTA